MKIYNTLTRRKEIFKPLKEKEVGMYVCGPTVYDESHIGHARAAYIFMVIRNYFAYKGYKVNFVQNITDVDDKIIAKAKEEWPNMAIGEAVKKIAQEYTQRYYEDMDILSIPRPTHAPQAAAHIEEMKNYISRLMGKGFAYESAGSVYFDVRKFRDYGRLSHQDLNQMRSNVRIDRDEQKRDALDFALWKGAKEGEPFWVSPWGKGRPGWHIECSVMSTKYLGEEFDIHGGGQDLIFPHHENEIAQAHCLSEKGFARIWVHNGLLTINGQKMAKSLGNFVTVKEFAARYHPEVLKLFFLQTHYSQPIDFTWPRIEEKRQALYKITAFLENVQWQEKGKSYFQSPNLQGLSWQKLHQSIEAARQDFEKYMDDDFNTPNAIAVLFEIVNNCNKAMFAANFTKEHLPTLRYAAETIRQLGKIFAISFQAGALSIPEKVVEGFLKQRQELREKNAFSEADQIRRELAEKGIILEDTKNGTIWRRKP